MLQHATTSINPGFKHKQNMQDSKLSWVFLFFDTSQNRCILNMRLSALPSLLLLYIYSRSSSLG